MTRIYTIGHSNHSIDHFLYLLELHGVATLADVRSRPYSRWSPHFQKERLAASLQGHGIEYVYLGTELGGRGDDPRREHSAEFQAGIQSLKEIAGRSLTAIMCAEEDPERCHRRRVIAPALEQAGLEVHHIRGDGRIEANRKSPASPEQPPLFDDHEKEEDPLR